MSNSEIHPYGNDGEEIAPDGMDELSISIAMCTYNGEKYLREQLDSIASQSRLPDELIVCDDHSSDHSLSIVETFSVSAPFPVRVFQNKANMGSTKNFEKAITLCVGDIIALSDQDDVWHNDKLKLLEEAFNSSEHVGVVFSNGNIVSEKLSPLNYTLWDTFAFTNNRKKAFLKGKSFDLLLNHNFITGATMAFRSSLRCKILPIPEFWVHDAWIALLLSMFCKITFIDKALIQYRQHHNQQIGGIKKSFHDQKAMSRSVTDYHTQILEYETALEHTKEKRVPRSGYAEKLINKIGHLQVRNTFNKYSSIRNVVKCTGELARGRYHRYSNGFLSFLKDISLQLHGIGSNTICKKNPQGYP